VRDANDNGETSRCLAWTILLLTGSVRIAGAQAGAEAGGSDSPERES